MCAAHSTRINHTTMKTILIALALSMPIMAQQAAPSPEDAPPPQPGAVAPHGDPRRADFLEKFDTNKDGRIDEQEKLAIRQAHEARKAEFHKKILEKYDADKDGQLDEQEKAAIKADFEKNGPRRPHMMRHGGHGPAMPPQGCPPPKPPCDAPQAGPGCPPPAPSCCCCCAKRGHGPRPHGPKPPREAPEAPTQEASVESSVSEAQAE